METYLKLLSSSINLLICSNWSGNTFKENAVFKNKLDKVWEQEGIMYDPDIDID